MDFLAFFTAWFWYLMAFLAGAVVAWLVVRQFVPARTPREAIDHAVAKAAGQDPVDRRDDDDLDDDTMPMEVQR